MRRWIALSEAAMIFYHGSRKALPVGTRLASQPDGYVHGSRMDAVEREAHFTCEGYLERGRPSGAPKRTECVYMVTGPDDIDYAGGYSNHVYIVEPEGQPWKANLHWYSALYAACFDDNISWEEAEPLVECYWDAVPVSAKGETWFGRNGDDLFEYLAPAAIIVREV
jgi:hypothetical protein